MADLFEDYTTVLHQKLEQIEKLSHLLSSGTKASNVSFGVRLRELEKRLAEAEETIGQLELEARSGDAGKSGNYIDEVTRFRVLLREAKDRARAFRNEADRLEFLGGTSSSLRQLGSDHQLLHRGSVYLKSTVDMAHETENIGVDTLQELHSQERTILGTQNHLEKARLSLLTADEYLEKLLRQGRLNRVVLYTVGGAILAAFAIIILCRLGRLALFAKEITK